MDLRGGGGRERVEPDRGRETEVKRGGRVKKGEAGQGFIPADKGRDMTPVGEETDYKGRDRGGGRGAEMEEEKRQREAGGGALGEEAP